jgi:hypothetical protein
MESTRAVSFDKRNSLRGKSAGSQQCWETSSGSVTDGKDAGVVPQRPKMLEVLKYLTRISNREALKYCGRRDSCILTSAAVIYVLRHLGYTASALRVKASVYSNRHQDIGVVLGSDGDGYRLPRAEPRKWHGHLAVVVESRYLVDPTLDQVKDSQKWIRIHPLVAEVSPVFLSGSERLVLSHGNATVAYKAFPGGGGFKHAPDFRKSHWMPLAQNILIRMYRHFGKHRGRPLHYGQSSANIGGSSGSPIHVCDTSPLPLVN